MALTPQEELELLDLEEQELMLEDEAARAPKEAAPVQEDSGILETIGNVAGQVAGGMNKGLIDVANLPFALSGFLGKQANKAMGYPEGESYSLYDVPPIKAATERTFPKGESALADAAYTASEWGSGLPFSIVKGVSKAPDLLMAGGAALGESMGDQTGEVIGGMMGLAASMKKGKPPAKFSKADKKAVKFIKDNAENPDLAIKNLEAAALRGEKGTLADLSKDAGLYNLEAAVPAGTKTSRAVDEQMLAREQQIAGDIRKPFGEGDVRLAPEYARGELTKAKAAMESGAERATEALDKTTGIGLKKATAAQQIAETQAQQLSKSADELAPSVATDLKTSETSGRIKTGYETLNKKLKKDLTQPAWKAFDDGPPIEVQQLQDTVAEMTKGMPPELAGDLIGKYKTTIDHIGNWKGSADPKQVQYVLSSIKDSANSARASGNFGVLEKELQGIGNIVESSLKNPMNRTDFEKAIDASKELYKRTGKNTKIGKAQLNDEWETFANRIGFADEAGAASGRYIKDSESPALIKRAEEHIKALAKKEGLDEKFMGKYDQFLDHFPDLKKQLDSVVGSKLKATAAKEFAEGVGKETAKTKGVLEKSLAKETEKVGKRQKGLTKAISGEVLAKYEKSPITTIKGLLKNPDGAKELEKLNRGMKMSGGGDAFKAQLGDELNLILAPAREGVTRVSSESIGKFNNMRKTLVDSKVITKSEADDIADALQRSDTAFLRRQSGKQAVEAKLSEVDKLMASSGSAVLMSGSSGGNQLMMQAAVRRQLISYIQRKKYSKKVLAQIDDFIANPDKFYQAASQLGKGQSPEKAASLLVNAIVGAGQAASTLEEDE